MNPSFPRPFLLGPKISPSYSDTHDTSHRHVSPVLLSGIVPALEVGWLCCPQTTAAQHRRMLTVKTPCRDTRFPGPCSGGAGRSQQAEVPSVSASLPAGVRSAQKATAFAGERFVEAGGSFSLKQMSPERPGPRRGHSAGLGVTEDLPGDALTLGKLPGAPLRGAVTGGFWRELRTPILP